MYKLILCLIWIILIILIINKIYRNQKDKFIDVPTSEDDINNSIDLKKLNKKVTDIDNRLKVLEGHVTRFKKQTIVI